MKVPTNVLNFATDKNLGAYKMFQDYYNHFRSLNGAKNISFSSVDTDGKSISFDEKEALMNAQLKREILRVAGIHNFEEFALEQWVTNPMISWATFAVVSAMIDMILPDSIIDSIGAYTDVRTIGWGDSALFDVRPNDLFVVSKAGRASRTTQVHKQYNGTISIVPELRELTVQVSLYRVLSGAESLGSFVTKVVRSMESQMTLDTYNAFATAMAALPSTTTTGLQVAGYTQASLVRLCQQVQAWTGTKPIVLGTQLALVNVLPDDANYRYFLNDDYAKLGYVRTAFGYDVMALPQVANWVTPWGLAISNSYLWIIAPASQKIVKLVLEGSAMSNTQGPFENANLTQNATLFKSWGVGIATNTTAGVIAL